MYRNCLTLPSYLPRLTIGAESYTSTILHLYLQQMTCTQCHWQVLNHIHPSTSRLIDDNPARVVGSSTWNSRAQQLGQAQSWSAAPRPRKISKCRPYQRPAAAAACQHQGGCWLLAVKISRCVLTGGVVSCRRTHVGNVGRQRSEVRRQGLCGQGTGVVT